ncbi:hypothetical protein LR48_Vigan11g127500 [Vigna angularis]|uniref:Uncharacterized protein n=1 Tax=Phaseolus angularis TaxID=3914 RepID=A0A0L9VT30_PHAAN|nr:hypothetical protein LR48_Vigan11g127500 [Vigna angularis]
MRGFLERRKKATGQGGRPDGGGGVGDGEREKDCMDGKGVGARFCRTSTKYISLVYSFKQMDHSTASNWEGCYKDLIPSVCTTN